MLTHPAKQRCSPTEAFRLFQKRRNAGGDSSEPEPRQDYSGMTVLVPFETPPVLSQEGAGAVCRPEMLRTEEEPPAIVSGPPQKKMKKECNGASPERESSEALPPKQALPQAEPVFSSSTPQQPEIEKPDKNNNGEKGAASSSPGREITTSEQDAVLALTDLHRTVPRVWVCDVCNSVAFTDYHEACVHETHCREAAAARRADVAAAAMAAVARGERIAAVGEGRLSPSSLSSSSAAPPRQGQGQGFSPRRTQFNVGMGPRHHYHGPSMPPSLHRGQMPPLPRRGALHPSDNVDIGALHGGGRRQWGYPHGGGPNGLPGPEFSCVPPRVAGQPVLDGAAARGHPRDSPRNPGPPHPPPPPQQQQQQQPDPQQPHQQKEDDTADNRGCFSVERFKPFHLEKWMDRFDELRQFKARNGHCLIPHKFPENPQLARWCKRQRRQYKLMMLGQTSTMTAQRVKMLEDIGFVWCAQEETWKEKVHELRKYRQLHGNCEVPSNYAGNKQLAIWVKCQRRMYSLYLEGKPCSITPERIAELEKEGFVWSIRNNNVVRSSARKDAASVTSAAHPAVPNMPALQE